MHAKLCVPSRADRKTFLASLVPASTTAVLPARTDQPRRPDARIAFEELQDGYLGSASAGNCTHHYQGHSYLPVLIRRRRGRAGAVGEVPGGRSLTRQQ